MKRLLCCLIAFIIFAPCAAFGWGVVTVSSTTPSASSPVNIGPISIANNDDDGAIQNCVSACGGASRRKSGEGGTGNGWFGEFPANAGYWLFARFVLPSAIPSGATISNASVQIYSNEGLWNWDLGVDIARIYAQDTADAPQLPAATDCPGCTTGVAITTAYVDWTPSAWTTGNYYTSPNISSVIQELVDDNSGLASGAAIQLWIVKPPTGAAEELSYEDQYKSGSENVMKLSITYTE